MFASTDVLYIVLAFCVLWLSIFVCWLIYQVAMILKNVNDTISELREKIAKIEEAISFMRNKFDKATSGITLLSEGIKKVVDFTIERKRDKASKREDL